jgi:hypothetical protein
VGVSLVPPEKRPRTKDDDEDEEDRDMRRSQAAKKPSSQEMGDRNSDAGSRVEAPQKKPTLPSRPHRPHPNYIYPPTLQCSLTP